MKPLKQPANTVGATPRHPQLLFPLLRSALRGEPMGEAERTMFSPELLPELYEITGRHDLAHLLSFGLELNALPPLTSPQENPVFQAIYRHGLLAFALDSLSTVLEAAEIPFIPLKGSVIRPLYPQPWMRIGSDVDVLVREEHLEAAISHLKNDLNYTEYCRGNHDVSLFSPEGVHIELHYTLIEDSESPCAASILGKVWDVAVPCVEGGQQHRLPDEYLYFYHVAHMTKHFDNGGCGIRPFMDMWLLDRQVSDSSQRDALLERGGLLKFADAARRLSRVWFDGEEHDRLSQRLEHYILRGGVYGTYKNRIVIQLHRQGGRVRYALRKIFLPYDQLKFHYPILQKHKWLTPAMEVRRWCKLIFCGHIRSSLHELKFVGSISNRRAHDIEDFRRQLGLVEK